MKNVNFVLSIIAIGMSIFMYIENREYHKAVVDLKNTQRELSKTDHVQTEEKSNYLKKGTIAPSFSYPDENGDTVHENYSNKKYTLLVFSSSQCPYCMEFYPVLDAFQKANTNTEVLVLQEFSTPESNKKFLDSTKYNFKMLAAVDEVYDNYKIDATPTCVFLDSEHTVDSTLIAPTLGELISFVE